MFPAGHVQRIKMDQPIAAPRSFASVEKTFAQGAGRPLDCGELRQLMIDTVRHHMVADVPVGVFLSAGIDFERHRGAGERRSPLICQRLRSPSTNTLERRTMKRQSRKPPLGFWVATMSRHELAAKNLSIYWTDLSNRWISQRLMA